METGMTKEQMELLIELIEINSKLMTYSSKNWKTGKLINEKMEIKERLLLTL